jgi:hypothetical protein
MLNGFANNNRGFMNRTRAINQNFANAIGSTTANKECKYENVIVGYSPTGSGEPIIQRKLVCKTISAKFDSGFANAIGTPTKFNPVGYVPSKCVGGRCGSGMCCLKNGTNVATGVTADWCVPCSDFQKFDGGFANVNGGCGCGCSDNGFLGL